MFFVLSNQNGRPHGPPALSFIRFNLNLFQRLLNIDNQVGGVLDAA